MQLQAPRVFCYHLPLAAPVKERRGDDASHYAATVLQERLHILIWLNHLISLFSADVNVHAVAQVVPPWALGLLCLSKRLHSIYVLRLFNDGVAMLLAYAATALLLGSRWRAAALVYSAAVSIKMNVLLMAPPVLVVMLKVRGPKSHIGLQLHDRDGNYSRLTDNPFHAGLDYALVGPQLVWFR